MEIANEREREGRRKIEGTMKVNKSIGEGRGGGRQPRKLMVKRKNVQSLRVQ